jgi:hypothetical protein
LTHVLRFNSRPRGPPSRVSPRRATTDNGRTSSSLDRGDPMAARPRCGYPS